MPMYEYACNACGYSFERVQSFHDEPLTTCPECAGEVRRVISAVGIIFKGSGWYITDSKRQITAGKAGATSSAPDDAKSAAGDDGTSPDSTSPDSTSPDSRSPDSAPADGKVAAAADSGGGKSGSSSNADKAASGDAGKAAKTTSATKKS